MAAKVTAGFEPESVTIPITDILPLRLVEDSARKRRKFRQIAASIREIGIVQPPIVARRSDGSQKFLLLDGHLRIEVLKDLGIGEVACLVSLDDEAVTYNRQVNRLSPLQEHKMILKVIERGVPEERIAQALNVNVETIRAKRDLLNGICPEVASLLKDKHCPTSSFQALKKAKSLRQYEIAKTMVAVGDYSVAYARALVSASSPDQLVNPGEARAHRKVSQEEIAQIERELANLQGDVDRIEETFAADHLNLVLAISYVRSLLHNAQIMGYMETYHRKLLEEFQNICEATAPIAEAAE